MKNVSERETFGNEVPKYVYIMFLIYAGSTDIYELLKLFIYFFHLCFSMSTLYASLHAMDTVRGQNIQ